MTDIVRDTDTDPGVPDPAIARRVASFGRTRDTRDLWPDVEPAALKRALREIERVIRVVLAPRDAGAPHAPELRADGERDARTLGVAAFSSGTGALLAHWIAEGRVHAPPPLRYVLDEHLRHGRAFAARIESDVLSLLDAFIALGIQPIVIKGFHTARAYWGEPGIRPAADVDLVVAATQVASAEAILSAAGFGPSDNPAGAHPYKRHWAAPGREDGGRDEGRVYSLDRPDARNPWRVDLHASLDCEYRDVTFARLDRARDAVVPFSVAGREVRAPNAELALLIAACHVACDLHSMRLLRLVELTRIAPAVDWPAFRALLARTQAARFAYPAFALAELLAPGSVDAAVLAECRAASSRLVRRVVGGLVPAGGDPHKSFLTTFMWATGVRHLVRAVASRATVGGPRVMLRRWIAVARQTLAGAIRLRGPREA